MGAADHGELRQQHLPRIRFLGHATVRIELDGTTLLTDPLLRRRVSALIRRPPLPLDAAAGSVDAVLISHLHRDHLDVPSLRQFGLDVRLLGPRGAGTFLRRQGFRQARELRAGDSVAVNTVRVVATPARHVGFRVPFGPLGDCLGFLVEGSARIYFAGDTDLFPDMAAIGPVDVALLPVGGWGPRGGRHPGHLDPLRAAQALRLIRPKVAVPIHWGTFAPLGLHLRQWSYLVTPPLEFLAYARELAPNVTVRVLTPGESCDVDVPLRPAAIAGPTTIDGSPPGAETEDLRGVHES